MKLPHYENSWRGVTFSSLDIPLSHDRLVDGAFYTAYYQALEGRRSDAVSWERDKWEIAKWTETEILIPLTRRNGDKPVILSVAAGDAIPEQYWIERGYTVVLNECQELSLRAAKARFPDLRTIIADVRELDTELRFDLIALITVDYALDDLTLQNVFGKLRHLLKPAGIILNYTSNTLCLRSAVGWCVNRFVRRRYDSPDYVLWGWYRSPSLIARLAGDAGLRVAAQYLDSGAGYRRRPQCLWRLVPANGHNLMTVLQS